VIKMIRTFAAQYHEKHRPLSKKIVASIYSLQFIGRGS
jgi:hypothetical protein